MNTLNARKRKFEVWNVSNLTFAPSTVAILIGVQNIRNVLLSARRSDIVTEGEAHCVGGCGNYLWHLKTVVKKSIVLVTILATHIVID